MIGIRASVRPLSQMMNQEYCIYQHPHLLLIIPELNYRHHSVRRILLLQARTHSAPSNLATIPLLGASSITTPMGLAVSLTTTTAAMPSEMLPLVLQDNTDHPSSMTPRDLAITTLLVDSMGARALLILNIPRAVEELKALAISLRWGIKYLEVSCFFFASRSTRSTHSIASAVNELVGKVTKNPTKVEEGQIRKTEGKQALQGGLGGTSGSY